MPVLYIGGEVLHDGIEIRRKVVRLNEQDAARLLSLGVAEQLDDTAVPQHDFTVVQGITLGNVERVEEQKKGGRK